MNGRLQDYRLLWRAAISHGNPFSSMIVRIGLSFIALVVVAAKWGSDGLGPTLVWVWIGLCLALLLTWAYRFVPGAVQLAAPANAKLVPRARRRLIELFFLVWFLGMLGAVLASYADGKSGLMLFWGGGLPLGRARAAAGHGAGTPVLLLTFGIAMFGGSLAPRVAALVDFLARRLEEVLER